MIKDLCFLFLLLFSLSCAQQLTDETKNAKGTFGYDLEFLRQKDSTLVVLSDGESSVIISPKYQAKVFTSSAEGDSGRSFGWVNYKAFDQQLDPHMNAYGGENRLWLGPEGGKFSLFFPKDSPMVFANWKTPAAFDSESWDVVSNSKRSATLRKHMGIENYTGTHLDITIDRKIFILGKNEIGQLLGTEIPTGVAVVGYRTENLMQNAGKNAWTEATGMPCIWMLDMLNPSDQTTIIIAFTTIGNDTSKPATTNYFGEIPSARIQIRDSTLFFKADGKMRGKLGIHPERAKHFAGSYDPESKALTITQFDINNKAKYLNQEWDTSKPVFSGDAVNAYNDGPLEDGGQLGPFYELESVSPAAALKPGELISHMHAVYHFTGEESGVNTIAEKVLGVSLTDIIGQNKE